MPSPRRSFIRAVASVQGLKLVRTGWSAYPRFHLEHPQLAAYFFHKLIGQAVVEHGAAIFLGSRWADALVPPSSAWAISGYACKMVAREVYKASITMANTLPASLSRTTILRDQQSQKFRVVTSGTTRPPDPSRGDRGPTSTCWTEIIVTPQGEGLHLG